jgi:hypothetical protein
VGHDIWHDILISLWEFNMASSDVFAFGRSGLSEFLYAPVGNEANDMTLSLISVFARRGDDPWREAGRLAGLPKSEAIESLARIIAGMPNSLWPLQAATTIAVRLIALLPGQAAKSRFASPAVGYGPKAGQFLRIGLVLVAVACAAAYASGVLSTMNAAKPDGGVSSFAVSPR